MKKKIFIFSFLILSLLLTSISSVNATDLFKVSITGITNNNEGSVISTSSFVDNSATFSAELYLPSDKVTYEVNVKNLGSLDAILADIEIVDTENPAIIFDYSGINEGDVLKVGESITFEVSVTYNSAVTSQPTNLTSEFTITLNYEQYGSSGSGESLVSGDTIDIFGVSVPSTAASASLTVIGLGLLLIIIAIIVTRKVIKDNKRKM